MNTPSSWTKPRSRGWFGYAKHPFYARNPTFNYGIGRKLLRLKIPGKIRSAASQVVSTAPAEASHTSSLIELEDALETDDSE